MKIDITEAQAKLLRIIFNRATTYALINKEDAAKCKSVSAANFWTKAQEETLNLWGEIGKQL